MIANMLVALDIPVVLCGDNFALIARINEEEATELLSRVKQLFPGYLEKKLGRATLFKGEGIPIYLSLQKFFEQERYVIIDYFVSDMNIYVEGIAVFADPENNNPSKLSEDLARIARAGERAEFTERTFSLSNFDLPFFRFMRILKRLKKYIKEGK